MNSTTLETYHKYLEHTGDAGAAASLTLADALASAPSQRMLTVKEAAAQLQISTRRVYELCDSKEIKAVNIGRSVRIPQSSLPAYAPPRTLRKNRCL